MKKPLTYRDVLNHEFLIRKSNNSRYSLRAFARAIGISPSRLSDALLRRSGLSEKKAEEIADALKFCPDKKNWFCDLVNSKHARKHSEREAAKERLKLYPLPDSLISSEKIKQISDWYYFAILEIAALVDFECTVASISSRLHMSSAQVQKALKTLNLLGLVIEESGVWKTNSDFNHTTTDVPSTDLQNIHLQLIHKSVDALKNQPVVERDFSSVMMTFSADQLLEAKDEIKKFRRYFNKKFQSTKKESLVYCLNIHFFNLEKESVRE